MQTTLTSQEETDVQQLDQQQQQTAQPQIRFLSANVLQQLQQQQDVQQQTQQQQQQQQPQVITLQHLQNFMPLSTQQTQHDQQRAQTISVQSLPHQFLQVCKVIIV